MFRLTVFLTAAVVLWVQPARADFVLTGSEHLNVTSLHGRDSKGILFDSSTMNVMQGGDIWHVYLNDSSGLTISGEEVVILYAYNTSSVDITGGEVRSTLYAYNTSSVDISGGSIYHLAAHDNSRTSVSGGSMTSGLNAREDSIVDITGGNHGRLGLADNSDTSISGGRMSNVTARDNSSVTISGGSISSLYAIEDSIVDITGGEIRYNLYASDTAHVTLHGYDFRVTAGLRLEDGRVLGTGLLSGKWFDETPWILNIATNSSGATIMAIPEPGTLTLLAIAAAGLLGWTWRRRQ